MSYNLSAKSGGFLKRVFLNGKTGELIENNYIKPDSECFLKTLLPYKFSFDYLGLYPDADSTPPFDITIFGQWQFIIKEKKKLIKPKFYCNYEKTLSLQEWENLLKPISKIDVRNLHYKEMPESIPNSDNTMFYLLYNPDKSATIDFFGMSQLPPAKGENGVMVFLVGKGILPPLKNGWILLGNTYSEVWNDPKKLALYNSIYPPDKEGNPREFGVFQGLREKMIGF